MEASKIRHPDPVVDSAPKVGRCPQGKACLADTARPHEGHQARHGKGGLDLLDLAPSSNKTAELGGQVTPTPLPTSQIRPHRTGARTRMNSSERSCRAPPITSSETVTSPAEGFSRPSKASR
jgi:hypothetical protein